MNARGAALLDVPVSGSTITVEQGEASFIVESSQLPSGHAMAAAEIYGMVVSSLLSAGGCLRAPARLRLTSRALYGEHSNV